MVQQVVIIENKCSFGVSFKTIYPLSVIIGIANVMYTYYVDDPYRFIIDNFKFVKAWDPWMYDPLDIFI